VEDGGIKMGRPKGSKNKKTLKKEQLPPRESYKDLLHRRLTAARDKRILPWNT